MEDNDMKELCKNKTILYQKYKV
ncbi:MAG: hypothetical protein RLZZ546_2781, partial [Bacteroidota bacterium]